MGGNMKVALTNYVGKCGKTTLTANLLAPRMPNAPVIAIESINETAAELGVDVEQMRGTAFRQLFKRLMLEDSAIIDVGASNIEDFMDQIVKFDGAHDEIDFFIVPVVSGSVEQKESLKTIQALATIGIPKEKIRVVFNKVSESVAEEFMSFISSAAKYATLNKNAYVEESELFDLMNNGKTTIGSVLADETDYRMLIRQTPKDNEAEINRLSNLHTMKSMAKPLNRRLDACFEALFK